MLRMAGIFIPILILQYHKSFLSYHASYPSGFPTALLLQGWRQSAAYILSLQI